MVIPIATVGASVGADVIGGNVNDPGRQTGTRASVGVKVGDGLGASVVGVNEGSSVGLAIGAPVGVAVDGSKLGLDVGRSVNDDVGT
jgi:hypothetical protein